MNIQQAIDRKIIKKQLLIDKARKLKPQLFREKKYPTALVEAVRDVTSIHGWKCLTVDKPEKVKHKDLGKGDSIILDFDSHQVGYLSMDIQPIGSPPDAPLHMKLTFGEMPVEVAEDFSTYNGWISSSWLQEETIHVDLLPNTLQLPRRYSFRYVKIEVLDTSLKYRVAFSNIMVESITSADTRKVKRLAHQDKQLDQIDQVSIKTLQDCMQDIFEDGPKRDRRLWLGDLRLQALANYATFQNNDLVKKCLYLFAGLPDEKGRVAANLFVEPKLIPDDTYFFDYSLFFTTTLYDYYMVTKDAETLHDLWPTALKQVEVALVRLNDENIVRDESSWWAFIDWNNQLNKQASAQAILIYTLKRSIELAQIIGKKERASLENILDEVTKATIEYFWDEQEGFFVSGENRQISWASQVWMVLANVLSKDQSRELMNRLFQKAPSIKMNTPYMYHHLVEALLLVGEKEKAVNIMKAYWGGMVQLGADTFWELFNPEDKNYSPYGSHLINSYCHAWSCTPTYLIRKYKL